MVLVEVNEQGQVTLPPEARDALHLQGKAQLACEVADGAVLLRPAATLSAGTVYPPAEIANIRRGLAEIEAGRAYQRVSKAFLLDLIERANAADRAGRTITPEELAALLADAEARALLEPVGRE